MITIERARVVCRHERYDICIGVRDDFVCVGKIMHKLTIIGCYIIITVENVSKSSPGPVRAACPPAPRPTPRPPPSPDAAHAPARGEAGGQSAGRTGMVWAVNRAGRVQAGQDTGQAVCGRGRTQGRPDNTMSYLCSAGRYLGAEAG